MREDIARYTVHRAIVSHHGTEKRVYLVLEDGLPLVPVNKALMISQLRQSRPNSADAYLIADICNWLYLQEAPVSILDATLSHIYNYFHGRYVDEGLKWSTLRIYIAHTARLYESLILQGYTINKSIVNSVKPTAVKKKNKTDLTVIPLLIKEFVPSIKGVQYDSIYTKWYSAQDLQLLNEELSITNRCIFQITCKTGYRIDSALSICMDNYNTAEQWVEETRSKTGKKHRAYIPEDLAEMIDTYVIEVRSRIIEKTGSLSNSLFLTRNGTAVSYHGYLLALKRAGERISLKHPGYTFGALHTHAGRSTFAAALRSFQLDARRRDEEKISDADFCTLMDWSSLQCLVNYDIATRSLEVSPLLKQLYIDYDVFADQNKMLKWSAYDCR